MKKKIESMPPFGLGYISLDHAKINLENGWQCISKKKNEAVFHEIGIGREVVNQKANFSK